VTQAHLILGGWLSNSAQPQKDRVWWFHYQVKELDHPWAFKDHKPQRRIAALEMLGTLVFECF